MKKLFAFAFALLASSALFAQTAEEILTRMEEIMDSREKEGVVMIMDTKIPIIGKMTAKTLTLGEKSVLKTNTLGIEIVQYYSPEANYSIDKRHKKVVIEPGEPISPDDNGSEMLSGVADGYDVSITKETDTAWYIHAQKRKDNPAEDEPKTMDIVVSKANYYPISLTAKVSSLKITLHSISFGVREDQVTFNPDNYRGYTIVDKRSGN